MNWKLEEKQRTQTENSEFMKLKSAHQEKQLREVIAYKMEENLCLLHICRIDV